MTNVFTPKSAKKFSCKECDFECSKRSDWSRHISTQKHKIRTNTNDFTPKNAKQYHCNRGKMLFGFLFYRLFNVNMNSILNFSMKNFCKYIKFCFRP